MVPIQCLIRYMFVRKFVTPNWVLSLGIIGLHPASALIIGLHPASALLHCPWILCIFALCDYKREYKGRYKWKCKQIQIQIQTDNPLRKYTCEYKDKYKCQYKCKYKLANPSANLKHLGRSLGKSLRKSFGKPRVEPPWQISFDGLFMMGFRRVPRHLVPPRSLLLVVPI